MASRIFYKSSVRQDLRRLGKTAVGRLLDKIKRGLASNPERGTPLSGEFAGLFRYRIGEYRVIYAKISEGLLILRIGHRKDVYRF